MDTTKAILIVLVLLLAFVCYVTVGALGGPRKVLGLFSRPAPRYPTEVFLVIPEFRAADPAAATRAARKHNGSVATPQQLQEYIHNGGAAPWGGYVSTGQVMSAPGASISAFPVATTGVIPSSAADGPAPGVWVIAEKPPPNTAGALGVQAFNCESWFQP